MKYLCLIYTEESQYPKLSKAEMDTMMSEYREFREGVQRSGQLVGGERLHPTAAATTVRIRNGKLSTTDGPFAETKEQLGGYFMIEARDLNEAIQIASRIPGARHGSVEVRPVMEMPAPVQS